MKKCEGNIGRRTWKNSGPSSRRGGEKSYADADTIPEMAPSAEREGGFPAEKMRQGNLIRYST